MFLIENSLFEITKKQYIYKLKAYMDFFFNMALVQLLAAVISMGGVGGSGMSSEQLKYSAKFFSTDMVIGITLMGAFIMAIYLTITNYRDMDFTFVSTRLSSHLSNIAFLVTAGVAGAVTANLSGFFIRILVYLTNSSQDIVGQNFFVAPWDLFVGIIVTILYFALIAATGYFIGMLTQLHKIFSIFMGTLLLSTVFLGTGPKSVEMVVFFTGESSFALFLTKVILTVLILFGASIKMSNRLEVRR